MKLVKLTLSVAITCTAFAGGIVAGNIPTELDKCAVEHNVNRCKWIAVPAEEPRVVYKQADLLPPPAV